MKKLLFLLPIFLLAGCAGLRSQKPGDAGIHSLSSSNGISEFSSHIKQPENPAQSANQTYEKTTETDITLPPGSTIREGEKVTSIPIATPAHTKVTEKAGATIGAAQKDKARELAAKLSSLKGIIWVGVLLFIFGIASFVYPPLKVIVGGSVTTSAAITAGGLALIILPTLIVGNELLILGCVGAVVGIWFLAHRHGSLRGQIDALLGKKTPEPAPGLGGVTSLPRTPTLQPAVASATEVES